MGREHRIISALQGTAVPVAPAVGLYEDGEDPFYVMDWVEGPILRSIDEAGEFPDADDRRAIGERVVDTLVAIHEVDPDAVGLGELAKKEDYVARQLHRWQGQWEKQHTRELPLVDEVHDRLAARIPEQGPATIVHGDYRLDNMILAPSGEVAAVVDWELCTLGDPLADVGLLLVYWGEEGDALIPLMRAGDDGARVSRLASEVSAATPSAPAATSREIDFYVALGLWKLAIILEGVFARYSRRPVRRSRRTTRRRATCVEQLVERRVGGGRRGSSRAQAWTGGRRRGRRWRSSSASSAAQRLSSRRAITILWTSSGPSATLSMREKRHIPASGVSSDIPSEPWTWIARSSTSMTTLAATTLIIEISRRASFLPSVSIFQAAIRVSRRACSVSIRDLATKSWTNCFSASFDAERLARRWRAGTSSRSPARRCRSRACSGGCGRGRAGPGRSRSPAWRGPSRFASGTRQSS